MTRSVSIVIPTRNRAEILGRSLESLRRLTLPEGVAVEVLIVANACTDDTGDVVRGKEPSFPFSLRLVAEPSPGLNVARNAGVRLAGGEVVAFLDDDAFVDPGWLVGLVDTFGGSSADLVAGKVVLWWEAVDRPEWSSPQVERLLSHLDLGDRAIELPKPGQVIGANFAVRREAAEALGGFAPELDRAGDQLLSGGDTDFALRARRAGFRLYYSPAMAVRHWVAPTRLSRGYLSRLSRARGRTRVALNDRTGGLSRARLLRHGLAQVVFGAFQELRWRLLGDPGRSLAAHLTLSRGAGTVGAVISTLGTGREHP